ncbi:MAG: phosphate ABC transporter ATP-binding protein [Bacillota bacterium]
MPGRQVIVELKNINKVYDQEVLRVEHLMLRKGSIHGIIGPSGSGKSTLLRIINLLTPPSRGSYYFYDQPVPDNGKDRLALQRKMALVFQKTLLFRESVFNNVAFGLRARGYSRDEIKKRVNLLLKQVGMDHLTNRRADTLSGGEAQRVAIARAIAFDPELLLLDEPTANLDPGNIESIEKMICQMSREKSITVVMVTHNVFQARRIADDVIFIENGKVVEMGPTEKVFNNPENERTRLYVEGRMIY